MVARRGVHQPPYAAVVGLYEWAAANINGIDGRLTQAGVEAEELNLRRLCNVTYAILMEGHDEQKQRELKDALESWPSRSAGYIRHALAAPVAVDPSAPPAPPRPAANLEGAKALIAAMRLPTK